MEGRSVLRERRATFLAEAGVNALRDPLRVQGLLADDEEYWPFEGEDWPDEFREPAPGRTLRTSIDLRIQYLAYRELKAVVQRFRTRNSQQIR